MSSSVYAIVRLECSLRSTRNIFSLYPHLLRKSGVYIESKGMEEDQLPFQDFQLADEAKCKDVKTDETTKQKKRVVRNKVPPPTHFIAFRMKNAEIAEQLKTIQQTITEQNPEFQKALVPIEKLHVTVLLLRLEDEGSVLKAIDVLQSLLPAFHEWSMTLPTRTFTMSGLETFNGKVLFAKVQDPNGMFQHAAGVMNDAFAKEGIIVVGSKAKELVPHVTLMKLSKNPSFFRKRRISRIPLDLFVNWSEETFGTEEFNHLLLCEISGRMEGGFYKCHSQMHFTLPHPLDEDDTVEC